MKEVHITDVVDGDVLAKSIRTDKGIVMLEAHTTLSKAYIERLKTIGIKHIFINDEAPTPNPTKNSKEYIQHHNDIAENDPLLYKEVYDLFVQLPFTGLKKYMTTGELEDRFYRLFQSTISQIAAEPTVLKHLTQIRQADSYLFDHALHVTTLSAMMGIVKNYDADELVELCIGALLCDIGMTCLPAEIRLSKGLLSSEDQDVLQRHTMMGYDLLKNDSKIPHRSALCALQHHERYDGSGYPYALSFQQMDEYAQIIGIVDVYHALISARRHRKAYSPSEATEFLFGSGNYLFHIELIQLFLKHLVVYPATSVVVLSSGQIAVVVTSHSALIHRPLVKVIREADGSAVLQPYEIDLRKKTDLVILGVLNF